MMSKLTVQGNKQGKQYRPKIYQGKREDRQRITMTKVTTRPDTDLTLEIGECHLEVEVGIDRTMHRIIDRITEEDCSILTIIEMTVG